MGTLFRAIFNVQEREFAKRSSFENLRSRSFCPCTRGLFALGLTLGPQQCAHKQKVKLYGGDVALTTIAAQGLQTSPTMAPICL